MIIVAINISQEDINNIVSRIVDGHTNEEEKLLSLYDEQIIWYVRKNVKNINDQEDLIQDIRRTLIENVRQGKYKPEKASLGSYVRGIAKFTTWNYNRRQKKIPNPDESAEELNIPNNTNPLKELIQQEEYDILKKEIVKLSKKDKEILLLFYIDEKSITEIGNELGMSNRKISERKHSAINRLEKRIQKKYYA